MPESAGENVFRSFLISLGFDIDEGQYAEFESKLKNITDQFEQFAKVAAVAGTEIVAAVIEMANSMAGLQYSSERAATSLTNLMGIRFAGSQVGIGADEMAKDLEHFASVLRTTPGIFQALTGMTPGTDNAANLNRLLDKLHSMDASGQGLMARLVGQQFGLSDPVLTQIFANWKEFIVAQQQEAAILKAGGITNKIGPDSVEAQRQLGIFLAHWQTLSMELEIHFLPYLDKAVVFLTKMVDLAVALDGKTHGLSTEIGAIVLSLASAAKFLSIFGILKGGAAAAGEGAAGASIGAGLATGGLAAVDVGLGIFDFVKLRQLYQATFGGENSAGSLFLTNMVKSFEGFSSKVYSDVGGHATIGYGHEVQPGEDFSGGITQQGAMQLLARDMATASQAVERLVKTKLNSNQLQALTDLVYNIGAGSFAKSTLLKDLNVGDFTDASGEFTKWANVGGRFNQDLFNRRLGEQRLFNKPVEMNQEVNIHVTGSSDPQKAADQVAAEIKRTNGDLVRNFSSAIQ